MTTLQKVLAFIHSEADAEDLTHIYDAAGKRTSALRSIRSSGVRVGAKVTLRDISPAYLKGLTGEVVQVRGVKADVRLSEVSTTMLRRHGSRRWYIPPDVKEHVFTVHTSTCEVTE